MESLKRDVITPLEALQEALEKNITCGEVDEVYLMPPFSHRAACYQYRDRYEAFCSREETLPHAVRALIAIFIVSCAVPVVLSILAFVASAQKNGGKMCGRMHTAVSVRIHHRTFYNRLEYCCAAVMTAAFLIAMTRIKLFTKPPELKWFGKLITVFLTGLASFPMFAAIFLSNLITYVAGIFYIAVLLNAFGSFHAGNLVCFRLDMSPQIFHALVGIQYLPFYIASVVLAFRFVWKSVRVVRGYNSKLSLPWILRTTLTYDKEQMKDTEAVKSYLKVLVNSPKSSGMERKTGSKIVRILKKFYHPAPGFRYSVGILIAFTLSCAWNYHLLFFPLTMYGAAMTFARSLGDYFPSVPVSTYLSIFQAGFFAGTSTTVFVNVLGLFLFMRNYRNNLRTFYRGQRKLLVAHVSSPASTTYYALKFIGYQLGNQIWGSIILGVFCVFFYCSIIMFSFAAVQFETVRNWLFNFLRSLATGILLGYVVPEIIHTLVIRYFFLRKDDAGKASLAYRNNNLLSNYEYFMIFVCTPMGLFSSAKRILFGAFFGLWYLTRLDISTMGWSANLSHFDTGHLAYMNFLIVENSMLNPVMHAFIVICKEAAGGKHGHLTNSVIDRAANSQPMKQVKTSTSRRALNKWFVAYTLIKNPILLQSRRGQAKSVGNDDHDTSVISY